MSQAQISARSGFSLTGLSFRAMAFVTAVTVTMAVAGAVLAQNVRLQPAFGTLNLSAGFQPDPVRVNVLSGGQIDASLSLGGPCLGFISNAPDVNVNYRAGGYQLAFYVRAGSDTTLIINDPQGNWYCDDDGGTNVNPSIVFGRPVSGQYNVWIGTFGGPSFERTSLRVSEIYTR